MINNSNNNITQISTSSPHRLDAKKRSLHPPTLHTTWDNLFRRFWPLMYSVERERDHMTHMTLFVTSRHLCIFFMVQLSGRSLTHIETNKNEGWDSPTRRWPASPCDACARGTAMAPRTLSRATCRCKHLREWDGPLGGDGNLPSLKKCGFFGMKKAPFGWNNSVLRIRVAPVLEIFWTQICWERTKK